MALRRAWVVRVTAGELVGFTAPAVAGAALAGASLDTQVAGMVGAGAVEGAVLGLAQASILVRVLPSVSRSRCVVATAGAAAFAWMLGMLPAATHRIWSDWPIAVAVTAAIPLGLLLLVSIGVAQAWVLPAWRFRWVAIGLLGGAAMALVMAAVTAQALPRLARLRAELVRERWAPAAPQHQ